MHGDKGGREGGGDISRGQCPAAIVSSAGMGWWRGRRRRQVTTTTKESTTLSTSTPTSTTIPTPQGYCELCRDGVEEEKESTNTNINIKISINTNTDLCIYFDNNMPPGYCGLGRERIAEGGGT